MSQTLTTGPTVPQQYGSWGITGQRMVPHPNRLLGLCLGLSNTGKTSLIASNPAALIINSDVSSTPTSSPNAKPWPAQFWPGINRDGQTIDKSGNTLYLRWEEVMALKDRLVEVAKNNGPRPETVVLDSIATAMGLLKDWVVRKFSKKDFRELDGRQAYDCMYDQLLIFAGDLRRAGYGVYFLGHLRNNTIPIGDDRYKIKLDLDVTDGFWKRIYPMCEFIFGTYKELKTRTIIRQKAIVGPKGDTVTIPLESQETYYEYGVMFNNEELQGVLKSRLHLPQTLALPEENAWATLVAAYDAALTPSPATPPTV